MDINKSFAELIKKVSEFFFPKDSCPMGCCFKYRCKKKESNVTRVEVIDRKGRSYVNWNKYNKVELSFQDEGRTLKIFITEKLPH